MPLKPSVFSLLGRGVHVKQNEVLQRDGSWDGAEAETGLCTLFAPNAAELFHSCSRQDVPVVTITSGFRGKLKRRDDNCGACDDTCSSQLSADQRWIGCLESWHLRRVYVWCILFSLNLARKSASECKTNSYLCSSILSKTQCHWKAILEAESERKMETLWDFFQDFNSCSTGSPPCVSLSGACFCQSVNRSRAGRSQDLSHKETCSN